MPNTLVHIGIQGLGNSLISSKIDLKWALLGCIIPDIPWIMRRVLITIDPSINIYDLRLYTLVQASLLFCIVLSLAFALASEKPRFVFGILGVNSLLHLLLDSLEIKWGNGVHLFAPLNWQLLSFDFVWPDSMLVAALSFLGLLVGMWVLVSPKRNLIHAKLIPSWRLITGILLVSLYFLGPLAFMDGPYSTDVNSIATLQERESRIGREVRMDREMYEQGSDGDIVVTFAGEPLHVVGNKRATSKQVSLIAEFVEFDTIHIHHLHEHDSPWRDITSYVGLGLIILVWLAELIRERDQKQGINS